MMSASSMQFPFSNGSERELSSSFAGRSRTPAPELPFTGQLSKLAETPPEFFLPTESDVAAVKKNLTVIVSRILTEYFPSLAQGSHKAHSPQIFDGDVHEV